MATYVVFGAYGGIGSELTRRLMAKESHVIAAGRNPEKLHALSSETGVATHTVDVTCEDQVNDCVQSAVERFGSIDGIVNCAGSLLLKPAHLITDDEWSQTIAVNLTSSFYILKAGTKTMMNKGGSLVFVSSAAARTGLANHEAIAAAKSGIIGMVISSAASYGARNIRVNCVAPGLVRTPLTSKITANEKAIKSTTAMHALGRIGEPGDVAPMIEWLLDPSQAWVTGQVFGIDGGLGTVHSR